MPVSWKLQDAKNRLSEVVEKAVNEGPQTITRRGDPVAVVISTVEYRKLTQPKQSLFEFLRNSPMAEAMAEGDFDLSRSTDTGRPVDL
jgi:prevent-host-death family protein